MEFERNKFQYKPSAFGFRNIIPKSRQDRKACKDKVLIEKSRIDQRVGWEAQMQRLNAPADSSGLTSCPENAAGYISNSNRFHSDTAGEQYDLRQETLRREKEAIQYRKRQSEERENLRWEKEDKKKQQEEEFWEAQRENGLKSKKNLSAVAYDITTMVYKQDITGARQKYFDDMVRYRAKMRTHSLASVSDTRVDYNIISGGARRKVAAPEPVIKPNVLEYGLSAEQMAEGPISASKNGDARDIFDT